MDLFKLRAVIGLDTSEYERGVKNALSLFQKSASGIEKAASGITESFGDVVTTMKKAADSFEDAADNVEDTTEAVEKMTEPVEKATEEVEKSSEEVEKSTEKVKKSTEGTTNSVNKYADAFEKAGARIKKTASAFGKVVAVGMGAAATAIGVVIKKSLDARGELEQNMGGSEQVFKEFADTVQTVGAEAYRKLGLSQSEYLATANKMGALLQGSGFAIEESMNMTTAAMQRAADVASIMGLDTSAAMEAIAGAAKGNFTMMDNLGVAINDTALAQYALSKGITKSTQEMSTQEKVGLAMELFLEKTAYAAGNYARENETLAGSLSTAKAAFDNFLSGAGTAEQLVESVLSAAKVVTTSLVEILPELAAGVSTLITGLAPMLPELISSLLPALISGAALLLTGLLENAPQMASALIGGIYDGIILALPLFAEAGASILAAFVTAITGNETTAQEIIDYFTPIWESVSTAAGSLFATLEALAPLISGIISSIIAFKTAMDISAIVTQASSVLTGIKTAFTGLFAVMAAHPIALVVAAIAGLVTAFVTAWNQSEEFRAFWIGLWEAIKTAASTAWEAITTGLSEAWNTIKTTTVEIWSAIYTDVTTAASDIWESVTGWFSALWTDVTTFASDTWADLTDTWNNIYTDITTAASDIWESVTGWFSDLWTDVTTFASDTWTDLTATWTGIGTTISTAAEDAWTSATTWFSSIYSDVTEAFNNLWTDATTIWESIKTAITTPIEDAKTTIGGIVDDILDFFDVEIEWPDIPLPHFSIKPAGWSIGDLLKGKLPSLGISWYNRAMNNPMLLRGATIFGMQDGQFLGGGDAGGEVVAGANTVARLIHDAVRSAMSGSFGGIVVNQNIYSEAKTAADLMQEARWEAERAVLTGV